MFKPKLLDYFYFNAKRAEQILSDMDENAYLQAQLVSIFDYEKKLYEFSGKLAKIYKYSVPVLFIISACSVIFGFSSTILLLSMHLIVTIMGLYVYYTMPISLTTLASLAKELEVYHGNLEMLFGKDNVGIVKLGEYRKKYQEEHQKSEKNIVDKITKMFNEAGFNVKANGNMMAVELDTEITEDDDNDPGMSNDKNNPF